MDDQEKRSTTDTSGPLLRIAHPEFKSPSDTNSYPTGP